MKENIENVVIGCRSGMVLVNKEEFGHIDDEDGVIIKIMAHKGDCYARGDLVHLVEIENHVRTGREADCEIIGSASENYEKNPNLILLHIKQFSRPAYQF